MSNVPYTKVIGTTKSPFYKTITGTKQRPVTNLALPCKSEIYYGEPNVNQLPVGTFIPPYSGAAWQQSTIDHRWQPYGPSRNGPRAAAYNACRSRFLDKIGLARAQGLTALAERKSTMEMVNKRLFQLLKAARALRTGDFAKFLKTLNVRPLTKHRNKSWNRPKEFGGLWLEYWFGWAPTIGDIYSLVDAYTNNVKSAQYIKAGGSGRSETVSNGGDGTWKTRTVHNVDCRCYIGATVEITNNDLLDLNEAGLLNPAQTALELVPFSWLAGWFVNLSQVLGSLTDTVGLKFNNGWITEKTTDLIAHKQWRKSTGNLYGYRDYSRILCYRNLFTDLPPPTFEWKLPHGLSVTRGATLASLIIQLAPTGRN